MFNCLTYDADNVTFGTPTLVTFGTTMSVSPPRPSLYLTVHVHKQSAPIGPLCSGVNFPQIWSGPVFPSPPLPQLRRNLAMDLGERCKPPPYRVRSEASAANVS